MATNDPSSAGRIRHDGRTNDSGCTQRLVTVGRHFVVFPRGSTQGVRCSMQHELKRLGTTPSQWMVVIGVGRPTCMPPTAQRRRSLRRRRDGLRSSLGNDQTGFSFLRFFGHTRFRRELEHGCLLAFI